MSTATTSPQTAIFTSEEIGRFAAVFFNVEQPTVTPLPSASDECFYHIQWVEETEFGDLRDATLCIYHSDLSIERSGAMAHVLEGLVPLFDRSTFVGGFPGYHSRLSYRRALSGERSQFSVPRVLAIIPNVPCPSTGMLHTFHLLTHVRGSPIETALLSSHSAIALPGCGAYPYSPIEQVAAEQRESVSPSRVQKDQASGYRQLNKYPWSHIASRRRQVASDWRSLGCAARTVDDGLAFVPLCVPGSDLYSGGFSLPSTRARTARLAIAPEVNSFIGPVHVKPLGTKQLMNFLSLPWARAPWNLQKAESLLDGPAGEYLSQLPSIGGMEPFGVVEEALACVAELMDTSIDDEILGEIAQVISSLPTYPAPSDFAIKGVPVAFLSDWPTATDAHKEPVRSSVYESLKHASLRCGACPRCGLASTGQALPRTISQKEANLEVPVLKLYQMRPLQWIHGDMSVANVAGLHSNSSVSTPYGDAPLHLDVTGLWNWSACTVAPRVVEVAHVIVNALVSSVRMLGKSTHAMSIIMPILSGYVHGTKWAERNDAEEVLVEQDDNASTYFPDCVGGAQSKALLAAGLDGLQLRLLLPLIKLKLCNIALVAARDVRTCNADSRMELVATLDAAIWSLISLSFFSPGIAWHVFCTVPHSPSPSSWPEAVRGMRGSFLGPALSLHYENSGNPPLVMLRGVRHFLIDAEGVPFVDCVNNVCHVGHCNPAVVASISRQAATLNTNARYLHPTLLKAANALLNLTPHLRDCESGGVVFFVCTASEANELALRIATTVTKRPGIVVFHGAYHGNTAKLMSISPYKACSPRKPVGAPTLNKDIVAIVPLPNEDDSDGEYEPPLPPPASIPVEIPNVVQIPPCGAALLESAPSCGGQRVLPPMYLRGVYAACRAAGAVIIADETQCGLFRIGSHCWAWQRALAKAGAAPEEGPDMVVIGKPLGNGHPVAAVICKRSVANAFAEVSGEYFNTFGGNPVSAAAALTCLNELQVRNFPQRASVIGRKIVEKLRETLRRHAVVRDVRGVGFWIGVELWIDATIDPECEHSKSHHDYRARSSSSWRPLLARAPPGPLPTSTDLVGALVRRGLLCVTDGMFNEVVKIKPPMTFDDQAGLWYVAALDAAIEECVSRVSGEEVPTADPN